MPVTRPVTAETLERLRLEREAADLAYNQALTDVDRALPPPVDLPPQPPVDDHQVAPLNQSWEILAGVTMPARRGMRSRLAHFVWNLVSPPLERQQAFNSRLVDHVNRSMQAERARVETLARVTDAVREHVDVLNRFHSHLIRYFQQFTGYVDSGDRLRQATIMAVYDQTVDALTLEVMRHVEALKTRDARLLGQVAAVSSTHQDLQGHLGSLQQATMTVKREMERLLAGTPLPGSAAAQAPPPAEALESYKYVGFEDRFRGSREEIRSRQRSYVPLFEGAADVLDVGCGRGEFLDLLREAGIGARGLDTNHEMVEVCRARGLDVVEGDLVSYLSSVPDGSLGGLIALQVVEHLPPADLIRALELAYHKLRPGSRIVLETINAASWFAFFSSYIRDLTHQRPLHPETLQYLLTASGFGSARIDYRSPLRDEDRLQTLPLRPDDPPAILDLVQTLNDNATRLNGLLFAPQDYAAIAERL